MTAYLLRQLLASSPRTWGCFSGMFPKTYAETVFPTHVGVFLDQRLAADLEQSLPHARGGVSAFLVFLNSSRKSSPRTWGCFPHLARPAHGDAVFPTHVGVFLHVNLEGMACTCLPHARGGVSEAAPRLMKALASSPRTWGCFFIDVFMFVPPFVFPTHVGVFPGTSAPAWPPGRLPHARGGVSMLYRSKSKAVLSSPRTWGVPLCSPAVPRIKKPLAFA